MRSGVLVLVAILGSMSLAKAQAKPNHLAAEHSPYRRRAIYQPVAWYPSSEDAFKYARAVNRPILLDVGGVWCPWCDLMDRDTYTKAETTEYINRHFVAVKVDFDASPKLVAQLQACTSFVEPSCRTAATSFITPNGKLYFGAAEPKADKPSFRETADEALELLADKSKINEESFQLEIGK
jgi:uncharacterized protein